MNPCQGFFKISSNALICEDFVLEPGPVPSIKFSNRRYFKTQKEVKHLIEQLEEVEETPFFLLPEFNNYIDLKQFPELLKEKLRDFSEKDFELIKSQSHTPEFTELLKALCLLLQEEAIVKQDPINPKKVTPQGNDSIL